MAARWHYPQSREDYATRYGVSVRTVSRWAKAGLPLENETETRLLLASGSRSRPESSANGSSRHFSPEEGELGGLGLSANIRRLQTAELQAHSDYLSALKDENEALAALRLRNWRELTELLRKVEQSTPDIQEANKKTLRLEDLQAELSSLFLRLRQDLEALPRRVSLELVGCDEIGIAQVLSREVEEIIAGLFRCKYLEVASRGEE